jgi:rhodanese-related sulfurtransferase
VRSIDLDELRGKIKRGDDFVLVDALAPMSFAHSHLPGAINLPPERVDASAPKQLPDKNVEVVVYCANPECESSVETAEKLVALGYTDVRHYAGGKDEWWDAELPLERAGAPIKLPPRRGAGA